MTRLNEKQLQNKLNFIENYINANNAADGSTFDANSNVTSKNVATLMAELNKDINIQLKRNLVKNKIRELFGSSLADLYVEQLEKHQIYAHDETFISIYCMAVSLYPFIMDGLQAFGGDSKAPKHLSSFNGGFINLVFALSSQACGAVATVGYLTCFDHFARKDYGENYLETHRNIIEQELQQTVYALNQPASARNFQSCFWNISIFDKHYFDALFKNVTFPDGTKPSWESVSKLQKFFMRWFNRERTKALLTFPVVTVALLHDNEKFLDEEYASFTARELSEGNSFFIYTSDTVDSLSSCCRLRNNISDQLNDFSYSLGAGGIQTGSINVITLNMNRFIQDWFYRKCDEEVGVYAMDNIQTLYQDLKDQIKIMHMYQIATRKVFEYMKDKGMLPAYDAGYISMDKQYLTIGINGLLEGAEFLGLHVKHYGYRKFISDILKTISDTNKESAKEYGCKFNTELVPAENLGVKFAKWDRKDNYVVRRDCYNSYLYPVEDSSISVIDKFHLHGRDALQYLDGGSALHLNLEEIPTEESARKLLNLSVTTGCNYFCINVKVTVCNKCGHIDKHTLQKCSKCGSRDVDYATRVIGYLKRITSFSSERQAEEDKRYYH